MNVDLLTKSIEVHEGNILYVYDDATGEPIVKGTTVIGNPSIGTGRLITPAKGISDEERKYLLSNDIRFCIGKAQATIWWGAISDNDARCRALVEIIFNIGINGIGKFVNALAALQRRDFATAANGFRDSLWFRQVGQRAVELTYMIEHGVDYVA